MRKDLDTVRERQIARETRSELSRVSITDWGWVDIHAGVAKSGHHADRVATGEELAKLSPLRPGTVDGGF